MGLRILAFALMVGLCGGGRANAQRIERVRLANGLTALLRPISGAQNACLLTLFRMGGDQDPQGYSGLAHLVEHVYVTAAAGARKARTADEFMQAYPAGWNAQTGEDYTVIATVFPRGSLQTEIRDAADRMGDLHIEASDLEREKPRILDEVTNMFGGMPSLAAWNLARERARPTPAHGRRGGVPKQVAALSLQEVQNRWQLYYKPVNALLVLTGDFDPPTAKAAIETAFGRLPGGTPAPPLLLHPPPRAGTTEQVAVKPVVPAAHSEVCLMTAAPSPTSAQYAAFLVLAARMQQRAAEIGDTSPEALQKRFPPPVYYSPTTDPAVFSLSTPIMAGETAQAAVRKLKAFCASAHHAGLQPGETAAAMNMFGPYLGIADMPDAMWAQNPYGLAFALGRQAQLGIDAAKLKKALNTLTTADLRRCVTSVFAPERWAAVILTVK